MRLIFTPTTTTLPGNLLNLAMIVSEDKAKYPPEIVFFFFFKFLDPFIHWSSIFWGRCICYRIHHGHVHGHDVVFVVQKLYRYFQFLEFSISIFWGVSQYC